MQKNAIIQDDLHISQQVAELEQDRFDQRAIAFLKKFFKNKPYFRLWWPVMLILFIFTLFENGISGFSAFSYTKGMLQGFVSAEIVVVVAVTLLVFIEILKQLLGLGFFKKLKKSGFDKYLFASLIMVSFISIVLTKKGSEQAVHIFTASPTLVNIDSIKEYYDSQVSTLEKDIAYYQQKSDTEKANWTILNVTLPDLITQKEDMVKVREEKIESAEAENNRIETAFLANRSDNAVLVSTNAWMLNIFSLMAQFALGTMLYKSALNYQVITDKPEPQSKQTPTMKPGAKANPEAGTPGESTDISVPSPGVRKIGFEIPESSPESAPENPHLKGAETFEIQDFLPSFQVEFSDEELKDIQTRYEVIPFDRIVQKARNSYKRKTTSAEAEKREEKRLEFEETYAFLTGKGYTIRLLSETGLSITPPKA